MASTGQLTPTITPSNATNKAVTYSSDNTAIATVNTSGLVTAQSLGSTIVRVKSAEDPGIEAECAVTVQSQPSAVSVTGVSLDPSSLYKGVGSAPFTLTPEVSPANATNKSVTWNSSNQSAATVSNGVVTVVGAGTTIITVKTVDGEFTATCLLSVVASALTGIELRANDNESEFYVVSGENYLADITILPEPIGEVIGSAVEWDIDTHDGNVETEIVSVSKQSDTLYSIELDPGWVHGVGELRATVGGLSASIPFHILTE
jgi:uncharacterized protein YjdB